MRICQQYPLAATVSVVSPQSNTIHLDLNFENCSLIYQVWVPGPVVPAVVQCTLLKSHIPCVCCDGVVHVLLEIAQLMFSHCRSMGLRFTSNLAGSPFIVDMLPWPSSALYMRNKQKPGAGSPPPPQKSSSLKLNLHIRSR